MKDDNAPHLVIPLIVADIYELAGRLRGRGDAIAATVGQTQARWQVMSAASADPRTVPQLARRLGVTRQNVQRIADLLVAERSARYETNPDHRGSPYLVLTARGRETLDRLSKAAAIDHSRLARKLSGADVTSIHRGLRRLIEAVQSVSEPPSK
jgi:DNA-binding MarR family transcriptional regulator